MLFKSTSICSLDYLFMKFICKPLIHLNVSIRNTDGRYQARRLYPTAKNEIIYEL